MLFSTLNTFNYQITTKMLLFLIRFVTRQKYKSILENIIHPQTLRRFIQQYIYSFEHGI